MNNHLFKEKFKNLESIWQRDEDGIEFIYARDLQKVLGYDKWERFEGVIKKGIISCESNGHNASDHFPSAGNMVEVGSGAKREIKDYKLTRYACYLTAQNGDPRKEEIAFAQNYFATQTRKFELVMQRKADFERVLERYELKEAERIFSEELYQRGVDDKGFAKVRSSGDETLFGGNTTKDMKEKLGVPEKYHNRLLADFLDPIAITAKKLTTQMSNFNVKAKDLHGETDITKQHIQSNTIVREALLKDNIYPEQLPAAEDIKKVENRLNKYVKTLNPKTKNRDFDK